MMPPSITLEGVGETFNPLFCAVEIKGNRWWSGSLALKMETIEVFEQVASAQRKLMLEAANIAINMQINHIQVQTLLAARLLDAREVKTSADLPDLQIDTATLPVVQGSGEQPPENDNHTDWSEGEQAVQTGVRVVDHESNVLEKTSGGKLPHDM